MLYNIRTALHYSNKQGSDNNMTTPDESYTETAHTVIHCFKDRKSAPYTLTTVLTETTDRGRLYYSITVLCRTEEGTQDIGSVSDITDIREEADRLFRLVSDGCVMPCTLEDAISDLLE